MTTVAAIQMNANNDLRRNLDLATQLIEEAKSREAQLAILPECFAFMAGNAEERLSFAEPAEGGGPIQSHMSDLAKRTGMWILAAGIFFRSGDSSRITNTSLLFDDHGCVIARYDKINLFNIQLPNGESYAESSYTIAGSQAVALDTPVGKVGLTVCYDVRFPQFYAKLASLGATWFAVPSAFSYTTGRDHWEVLLRARAIENRAYVVAPAQWGYHPGGRRTYGHTMIVDPWGQYTVCENDEDSVLVEELSAERVRDIRNRFSH